MATLQIKHCRVTESGGFPMIVATVKDCDHHKKYEIMEWLRDERHVDRRNSSIKDSHQVDESVTSVTEVFDALDSALKALRKQTKQRSLLVTVMKLLGVR